VKILIAGGAGFIGSHLGERFLKEGMEVAAIDNYITGTRKNIVPLLNHPRFTLWEHDITRPIPIEPPLGKFDRVFHFASPTSPREYQRFPIETMKAGSLGTLNLLDLALNWKAGFFFASSSEVYGDPLVHPQGEGYWWNVNPVGPRSVYDEGKRFSEALVTAYHRSRGLDIRIARIFNTYGPRMKRNDGRVIPNFVMQALKNEPIQVHGDGTQTRSFCYVEDLCEGILKLMDSGVSEPLNLGNPSEIRILDLAKMILEITKSRSEIVFHPLPSEDPKVRKPDIEKAKTLLGWKPRIELTEGLSRTIQWFQSEMIKD